jgi:hypothetical protein
VPPRFLQHLAPRLRHAPKSALQPTPWQLPPRDLAL